MRRSPAAPALPSLFDDDAPTPAQAAPAAKAAPVKARPKPPEALAPQPAPVKPAPIKAAPAPKAAAPKAPAKPAAQAAPKPVAAKAAPKPAAVKPAAAKPAAKAAKIIPVRAVAPAPPAAVRVIAETAGAGGRAWRLSGRYAVAYLVDSGLAGELLATEPKHLARAAMAVYYDRKGKAFAWQVRFDTERWDEVVRRLTA